MLTIAFIFATKGCDPKKDCTVIRSENITVHVVGVSTYSQAVRVAKELKEKGCMAIELCPAFGNKGVAHIIEAVGDDIPVGAVRFDRVPALGGQSGDALFDDLVRHDVKVYENKDEKGLAELIKKIVKEVTSTPLC